MIYYCLRMNKIRIYFHMVFPLRVELELSAISIMYVFDFPSFQLRFPPPQAVLIAG